MFCIIIALEIHQNLMTSFICVKIFLQVILESILFLPWTNHGPIYLYGWKPLDSVSLVDVVSLPFQKVLLQYVCAIFLQWKSLTHVCYIILVTRAGFPLWRSSGQSPVLPMCSDGHRSSAMGIIFWYIISEVPYTTQEG